jgi:hypothetical protein
MSATPITTYDVLGRTVVMPCVVRDASAGTAMFEVDAAAAQRLLPSDRFAVVESAPGRCQIVLAVIDYRDNDLGAYHEVGVTLFVAPRGSGDGGDGGEGDGDGEDDGGGDGGESGTFITRLPVDQEFTCAAGRAIWGFPKTVEDIGFAYADDHVTVDLRMGGEPALRLTLPRGGDETMAPMAMTTYSLIDGVPHATAFTQGGTGAQVLVGGDGVSLELGTHPVAGELVGLGLPAAAVMSTWTERMQGVFEVPLPLISP